MQLEMLVNCMSFCDFPIFFENYTKLNYLCMIKCNKNDYEMNVHTLVCQCITCR